MSLDGVRQLRPRPASMPKPPAQPAPPLIGDTGNAKVDAIADCINRAADPFQNAPDPAKGTLGQIEHGIGAVMGVVGAPFELLDTGFAMATSFIAAMLPGFPAAVLMMPHLGPPHAHMHPLSLTPPNPVPVPLPSIGMLTVPGAVNVLIGGLPAARAGDIGMAPTCVGFFPLFDVFTGSSNTWIAGSRAARMGDITWHCNPASAMNKIGKVMGAIGVVAGAVSAGAAAAAGQAAAATAAAAQAIADAVALAMGAMLGKDPGIPPTIGAIMMGYPMVLIGGFPMPDVLAALGGLLKGLKMLGKAIGKSKGFGKVLSKVGLCNDPGEPVSPFTGEVYNDIEDYVAPDTGLSWERHYRSGWNEVEGPFGYGYRHFFQRTLTLLRKRAVYETHDNERVGLEKRDDGTFVPSAGFVLTSSDGQRYELTTDRDEVLVYQLQPTTPPTGRLDRYKTEKLDAYLYYDSAGRLVSLSEFAHGVAVDTHLVYNAAGHIEEVRRGRRNQVFVSVARYIYREGCLTEYHNGLGAISQFRYDDQRRMVQATGPSGYSFHWHYDPKSGRCVKSYGDDGLWGIEAAYYGSHSVFTEPDGGEWTFKHYPNGGLSHIIGPDGGVTQYVQDNQGRVVRQVMPGSQEYTWLYDARGKHYGRRDPFGNVVPPEDVEPNFNPLAHDGPTNIKQILCGRPLERLGTALRGLPALVRTALHSAVAEAGVSPTAPTPVSWDAAGRVTQQVEPDGSLRTFAWDIEGNLVGEHLGPPGAAQAAPMLGSRGGWHTRQYGSWNLLCVESSPLGHTTRYEYSHRERWSAVVDANGNRTEYVRDRRHRISEIHRYNAIFRRYRYDASGAIIEEQDGDGKTLIKHEVGAHGLHVATMLTSGETYTYDYNSRGQFVEASSSKHRVRQSHDGARLELDERDGKGVEHLYDPTLHVSRTRFFKRFAVRYRRTNDSCLRITTPDGATHVIWQDHGHVVRQNGNGTCEALVFDSAGRLAARACWRRDEPGLGPCWTTAYRYNAAGDLLYSVDDQQRVESYRYDEDHRLVAQYDERGERCYAYDPAGNLTNTPRYRAVSYIEGNLLHQADFDHYLYDVRRRLAQQDSQGGSVRQYVYDSLDQLVEVRLLDRKQVWRAAYDGLGRRIWRECDGQRTDFYWDGDRLAAERSPDGKLRIYVYPNEESLVPFMWLDYVGEDADPASGTASYLYTAPTGMPLRVEDAKGNEVWRATAIDAYGEYEASAPPCPTRLRFAGHFFDEHLGLFYNRFRDYNPAFGRYLQPDPKGHAGGINLFAYSTNPLVDVDLRGLTIHKKGKKQDAADGQNGNKRGTEGDNEGPERPAMLKQAELEAARRGLVRREGPAGEGFPPGTRKVEYGDPTTATYHVDSRGRILRAEGELDPPTNYDKKGVDHIRPDGFVEGQDHRGHLIPERSAADQANANVRENVVAEHGRESNTSRKKRFENRAQNYSSRNPGTRMISEPIYDGDNPRPSAVKHTVVDSDGNVVRDPKMVPNPDTIPNPDYS